MLKTGVRQTMSKPNRPGELRNVKVNAVSLVNKAANGEEFKIFKSAKPEETESKVPESVEAEKNAQGLFSVLKKFFTGENSQVEKGAVADSLNARRHAERLNEAVEGLFKALGLTQWGSETAEGAEKSPIKIRAVLDDFRDVAEKILIESDNELVVKSGRKISSSRLAKIKEVHAILGELIADTDAEDDKGGTETVTKEDLINEVKKSVEEAVKPIDERLAALEKSNEEAEVNKEAEAKEPSVAEVVKSALDEALKPISERLEKVEKARGFSNRQPEDVNVKKSGDDFWAGAF